ncbi:MAG: hypothetical protein IKX34_08440 [Bacteroidales bacterium]|nr:hypothetical protein [Bacteroidales bacterium]
MKHFISAMLLAGALLTTGCVQQYYEKLDELEERVEELQQFCDKLNNDLTALRSLVTALENQDMVTGITELRSGSTVTGYRINFVEHDPVTIYNGKDGKTPLVASRQDPEDQNWYWTVQYGDGSYEWLRAADGTKMLSIGVLPYIALRDGWFCYTLDGKEWIQLGEANGKNGDQMFQSVDTRNENYVIFTLTNGAQFKIPTYRKYLELKTEFGKINDNADAQSDLLLSYIDKLLYITRVSPILSGLDTVGLSVTLSNGKSFRIHDWTASVSPAIFVKKHTDGKYYWAYTIGSSPEQWVLSPDGKKISASSETVTVPRVSIARDKDGQFYWTVTTGDNTEFLRFLVDSTWTPRAIDSVSRAFSSVKNYRDSLVIVLKDSSARFVLPKQYTVSITQENGTPVGETLAMKNSGEVLLRYVANGPTPTVALVTQGGFTATTETQSGVNYIRIKAPESFPAAYSKIMAFFTFTTNNAPVTVIKTINITQEG